MPDLSSKKEPPQYEEKERNQRKARVHTLHERRRYFNIPNLFLVTLIRPVFLHPPPIHKRKYHFTSHCYSTRSPHPERIIHCTMAGTRNYDFLVSTWHHFHFFIQTYKLRAVALDKIAPDRRLWRGEVMLPFAI